MTDVNSRRIAAVVGALVADAAGKAKILIITKILLILSASKSD